MVRRSPRRRPAPDDVGDLPTWPFWVFFAGYPVFWLLGLSAFAIILSAVPMILLLWDRRHVELPPAFGLWVLFVLWVCISGLQVTEVTRLIGFAVRLFNYIGATALFVYLFNCSHARLPQRRAALGLAAFFAVVVAGGYLGVLIPDGRITTPFSLVLPGSIASNDYVGQLVRPSFAEVQQPYGSPVAFTRPSAPFAYTNGWGCNTALLVPCMIAAISGARGRTRLLCIGVLMAAVVPAAATLNRGMYLAIGLGLGYAALRLAMRSRLVPLVGLISTFVVVAVVAVVSGVAASLQQRLQYSESSTDRLLVYQEAFDRTVTTPLLGNGTPLPSTVVPVSVGTQGQVWNVMFSYGFLALALFIAWFAYAAWASRHWRTDADLWLHVSLMVAFMTIFYYGYDGPQLMVMMAAAALRMRPDDPPPAPLRKLASARASAYVAGVPLLVRRTR